MNGRMPVTSLGRNGPVVSRIGLGLAALGRPAYITTGRGHDLTDRSVAAMRARTFSVLDSAYAAGVRYADAARSYGRAEEFLAGWLADRGHADMVVGSKWGYRYTGGPRGGPTPAGGWTPTSRRSKTIPWPCSQPSSPRPGPCSATGSRCTRCTR